MSSNPPGLGPHVVGRRVVVRRVLRGETGATGGPAFTDVLGVLESWADRVARVRTEDGRVVEIPVGDIVSGKPVPPRPSPRLRVPVEVAERRALASWPPVEREALGDWVLRAAGGYSARVNSVLASGDPGVPLSTALARVRDFYASRGLPRWAQVVTGSDEHQLLEDAGWVAARPGEADTLFQLASVSAALREVRRWLPPVTWQVKVRPTVDEGWLADDERSRRHGDTARAVLEGSPAVGFVSVREPASDDVDRVVAKGRVAVGGGAVPGDQDWAGITNIWVAPELRRRRLGTVVMHAMLEWAAEQGATTAFLQVRGDNPAALAAYERLGFTTHHAYRYLTAP